MKQLINKLTGKSIFFTEDKDHMKAGQEQASEEQGFASSPAPQAPEANGMKEKLLTPSMPKKLLTKETTKDTANNQSGVAQQTITAEDLKTNVKPTWCPGCGDFGIWFAIKNALQKINTPQENILIVYGIGCHGHMCNSVHTYGFEGLHGRPVPVAEGAKLANSKLKVIVVAGDGDTYGEGFNHFISGIRGNHDITHIVHNNMVYGLTTGQTSPTSEHGYKSKSTPKGVIEVPINPLAIGISAGGSFISRGFAGNVAHLTDLIVKAIDHDGYSLVDVFQNCVTFNKQNTIRWFNERVYKLEDQGHDSSNKMKALEKAFEWGEKIPIGIFYQDKRDSYEDDLPTIAKKPLVEHSPFDIDLTETFKDYV